MAKARAIVKRRKAVRNIRKITKTMQMIATAKFQKALRRAVGAKPYTHKVRQIVAEVAANLGTVTHPLLGEADRKPANRIAMIVITSNRGLAGAYNGSVLRMALQHLRQLEAEGKQVDLYVSGKKGVSFFQFQKRPLAKRYDQFADMPRFADVRQIADFFMRQYTEGAIDSLQVAYMNFVSAGTQKAEVMTVLPLGSVSAAAEHLAHQIAQKDESAKARPQRPVEPETIYEFTPSAPELLDELLPLTVRTALFQAFLDAVSSENVARMVAMKSATDNADKMVKSLTMQYNRARQSQITTELSEIMGGVEAMKNA